MRAEVLVMLQEIQYFANAYYAAFYTLENNVEPFERLMKKIGYAIMVVEVSSNYLDNHTRNKVMDYLIATHNNLLFSVDRLKGHVRHWEWYILPDIEQRCGNVFMLYQKAQRALR